MYGTTIRAIAAGGQTDALKAAGQLLAQSGLDAGVCRFLPSGVTQWHLRVAKENLPHFAAMLAMSGIEMTVSGQSVFTVLCRHSPGLERMPPASALRTVSLLLELHPDCAPLPFDDCAVRLPLCA